MNEYGRGYMQIKREERRSAGRKRAFHIVCGCLALLMYGIASNMAFQDCINWGIC